MAEILSVARARHLAVGLRSPWFGRLIAGGSDLRQGQDERGRVRLGVPRCYAEASLPLCQDVPD